MITEFKKFKGILTAYNCFRGRINPVVIPSPEPPEYNTITGTPPLSFNSLNDSALTNYRIYGNTVEGYYTYFDPVIPYRSVGNNINTNLFSLSGFLQHYRQMVNGSFTNTTNGFSITATGHPCFTVPYETARSSQYGAPYSVNVESGKAYEISFEAGGAGTQYVEVYVFENGIVDNDHMHYFHNDYYSFTTRNDTTYLTFRFGVYGNGYTVEYTNIKLQISGAYQIPVNLAGQTFNISLTSQLGITNGVADYIDFATRKRYNADGTTENITLPSISTLSGTNTLSVGTTVQPSSVSITGYIQAINTDDAESEYINDAEAEGGE